MSISLSQWELGEWDSKALPCCLLLLQGGVGISQDADVAVADVSARLRRRLGKAAPEIEQSHGWSDELGRGGEG